MLEITTNMFSSYETKQELKALVNYDEPTEQ